MSDHIGYFLNLRHYIIEAGEKLDDIHVVHAILLSLPRSSIWDVVKQNLLDKGKALTLDMVSAELISVHDRNERDQVVEETEKKAKAEYHKWSLTICDGCFDTLKSSKMRS